MRVTKVVKDYIKREINKKYQEKLDSIPNDYQEDYNKMIEEIRQYAEKRRDIERELKKEKDDKIAQIILDLELGEVNKKELNDVLNNISF